MTPALDALARLDDTTPLPGDTDLLAVLERHCQAEAPIERCLICRRPCGTPECDTCYGAHDYTVSRLTDI